MIELMFLAATAGAQAAIHSYCTLIRYNAGSCPLRRLTWPSSRCSCISLALMAPTHRRLPNFRGLPSSFEFEPKR